MALRDVNAVVTITTNAVKAIDDGKKLKQIYADINEQLNLMKSEGKVDTKEFKDMQKLAEDTKAKINEMLRGMELIDKVMGDISGHIGKDLNRALRETAKEFNKTSSSTDEGKAKLEKLRDVVSDLKRELSDRKGLTMSLKDAEAQLKNLNNASLDKLKQGLKAVEEEAEKTTSATGRERYQGYAKQYRAQIAVNELGRAGSGINLNASSESLQKEAQRLRQGFMATEGVRGYESISNEYLSKLQAINDLLAKRAEKERQVAQEQKKNKEEIDRWNKAVDTWQRMAIGQKVSVEELTEAYKTLELELKKMQGVDPDKAANIKNGMEQIKSVIDALEGKHIDIDKIISDPNATLEQLDAALKKVQEDAAKIPAGFDWDIKKNAEDAEDLKTKIAELKDKMQGIADIDYDNLEFIPTEKLEAALKSLEAQEKKLAGNQKSEAEQVAQKKKKVQDQINKNKQATMDFASAEKMAGETGKHSISDLQKAYDTLKQKLMGLSTGQKGEIEKTRENMAKLKKAIDDTTGSIAKQGGIWQTAIKNITAYVGVFGAFNFIKGKLTDVIRLNLELSDSMANIRKVSGLAMRDIEDLTRALAKMDTRTTLAELEEISYRGAKLGFGNYGTQGLLEFAQAANVVNVALKEDLGDEALAALSKITENMGLIKKMGVQDAMLATGSAMFQLAASSTAAAGPIVEVTKRLVPVAQMSGFATHEILALASASDSLHLMPEIVGTALSKLIMALQKNHNLVEKYLGIDEGTIAQLFKAGDAMDALLLVFDKMNGKNVTELDSLWKLLGSDGQRLITVVADMANHTDTLRTHLETSTKAFMEGTAVTDEYNIQQQTAAALIERANNAWRNAFVNPDAEHNVKGLAQAWYDFSKGLLDSELTMKGVTLALNLLLGSLKLLLNMLPALTAFAVVKMFNKLRVALMESKIATDMFATSWKNMTAATKANWIGLILGAVTQLAFWIKNAASESDDLATSQKRLQDAMSAAQGKAEEEINSLARLKDQLNSATLAEEDRAKILSKVKSDYDHYLNYLGVEINTVDELTKHYDALTKVMKQRFAYQEREEYKRENLQDIKQERRNAGADLKRMGKELGVNVDLSLVDQYVKGGAKTAGEAFTKMFPDIEKTIAARQKTGMGGGQYGDLAKQFASYFGKVRTEVEQTKKIDDAFAEEIGDFDYDKYLRTQIKGDFKVKPDKEAEKAARAAEAARRKALREEMKEEQTKAKAIIDNVKNYYERQINAVTDMAVANNLSKDTQDTMVDGLRKRMNIALAQVRKAIGGTENEWEKFKQSMREDLYEPLNENNENFSTELLDKVLQNNVSDLRQMIETLSKALNQQGSVLLDQILRKATENEGKNTQLENKRMQARRKELLERNYTGKVDADYQDTMEQFGIGAITDRQSRQIRTWSQNGQQQAILRFFDMRTKFWEAGFKNVREHIVDIINTDIEQPGSEEKMLAILFGKDWKEALTGSELEGVLNMSADMWKVFYMKLIEYTDQWTDAQKKAYDENKKRQDYLFKNRPDIIGLDQTSKVLEESEQNQNLFGTTASFGRQLGFVDTVENDPEIARLQILEEKAERYYERMKELRALDLVSEQDLQSAKDALATAQINTHNKVVEAMQARTQAIQNAIEPVTQFAEDAGQKLGDMMFNMESQSMTWEQIWKKMVLAMAKSVIQMGQQYLVQKIQRQMFNAQVEADETTHQSILTAIALGGAIARMEGELAIDQGRLVQKKIVNGEEITEEISLATILTALGISEGAAKTIGSLGWWGIPLVAVISALLMGLLSSALSTAGAESSKSTSAKKVKLASGMLTYDEGNVQTVVGDDGRVYRAKEQRSLPEGVSMVTEPIATRVNGQQALVGERGPEIVIGRKTTRAIQMNRPDLLRDLALIDRGITTRKVRTFDEGSLSDLASAIRPIDGLTDGQAPQGNGQQDSPEMRQTLDSLSQTVAALSATVLQLQKNGIPSYIKKYGTGGLIDEVQSGLKFVSKYK